LHEYQSKDLMESHGVLVQKGEMAKNAEEAFQIATRYKQEGECQNLNSFKSMIIWIDPNAEFVVKAQIHAGGRGKGHFTNGFKGGVHVVERFLKFIFSWTKNNWSNYKYSVVFMII